jgi:catalase
MSKTTLTTSAGAPVADDNNSISVGARGPLTFDNHYLFEKLAHFNRERIPERVVHARGTGAYGHFTVTKSLSDYTIADFLQSVGNQTDVFIRFSTVGGGQDSSDFARDPRGFAVKFYTREGNYDIVGNNTPVFFLNDGIKFPDFIHSQKKNPRTNLPDPAAMYEFWANHPQSLHQMTVLMSDRERYWVKWHFKSNQGIKTVTSAEAATLPPFGNQQDLVEAIDRGDFPSWTVSLQIMTDEQSQQYHINPFDLTKVWPHKDFPLIPIGQLELNRNVENYFAETEQAAFAPSNMVPGTGASPDKMLQARLLAYQDAHRYRVGVNANQIPVNAPRCPVNHYQRDGAMAGCPMHTGQIQTGGANFYPNDRAEQGAPAPAPVFKEPPLHLSLGAVTTYDQSDEDYYTQAGDLFRLMNENQKQQLTGNIADGLRHANASIQQRMLGYLHKADPDYAARVKALL